MSSLCILVLALDPYLSLTKTNIFPTSGLVLNIDSIKTAPKNPVPPVTNTLLLEKNDFIDGFFSSSMVRTAVMVNVGLFPLILWNKNLYFKCEKLANNGHSI